MSKSVFHLSDGEEVKTESEEEKSAREMEEFAVKDFIDGIKADLKTNNIYLPTLPTLALEALLVINDSASSAADLEKVISKDAALTARLIRYANSPIYRGVSKVTAIKLAITRIGFQRVKNAVYAVSMKEVFRTPIKAIEKRMEELWAHSVKVGAHAAMLAKAVPRMDPNIALVAGLVHDIGKIPLLVKACDFPGLSSHPEYLDRLIHKLHPQIGGTITKMWKFDKAVVQVAAEHENLERDPGDDPVGYVDIIQVANIMAYENSKHPLATVDRTQVKAFARLGLREDGQLQVDIDEDTKAVEDIIS
jgi:putative nucleotidyltransferase with HDIG domain